MSGPLSTHHYCSKHDTAYPAEKGCPQCKADTPINWESIAREAVRLLRKEKAAKFSDHESYERWLIGWLNRRDAFLARPDIKKLGGE